MAHRQPINPFDIVPAQARKVESEFKARPKGSAWAVVQQITWQCRGDYDGSFFDLAEGLTETEARILAATLGGNPTRSALVASVAAIQAEAA